MHKTDHVCHKTLQINKLKTGLIIFCPQILCIFQYPWCQWVVPPNIQWCESFMNYFPTRITFLLFFYIQLSAGTYNTVNNPVQISPYWLYHYNPCPSYYYYLSFGPLNATHNCIYPEFSTTFLERYFQCHINHAIPLIIIICSLEWFQLLGWFTVPQFDL